MPVAIGAKRESDFSDPLGMLSDCHRRIERFLGVLVTAATQSRGAAIPEEQRAAFANALRYFREAAPRHTADEEESLFPRMRRTADADAQAVLAQIDSLRQDHIRAEMSHQEIAQLGERWLARGAQPPEEAARLLELLTDLAEHYRRHIATEDREVFPCAARVLSDADRAAVGAEMAARRGVPFTPGGPNAAAGTR